MISKAWGLTLLLSAGRDVCNLFIFNTLRGARNDWQAACTEEGVLMCLHLDNQFTGRGRSSPRRVVS